MNGFRGNFYSLDTRFVYQLFLVCCGYTRYYPYIKVSMVYGFDAFGNEARYIVFQVKLIITRMIIRTNTLD